MTWMQRPTAQGKACNSRGSVQARIGPPCRQHSGWVGQGVQHQLAMVTWRCTGAAAVHRRGSAALQQVPTLQHHTLWLLGYSPCHSGCGRCIHLLWL